MSGRTTFDWLLFTDVWEGIVQYGKSEYGETADEDGYLVRIIETAMREAIRENRHAEVEEKIDTLAAEVGVRKKDLDEDELDDEFEFNPTVYRDKTRVVKQVDADLLRRWKRHADESNYSYGVLLSKHLKYYLWGGQPRTLTERVDRVLNALESYEKTGADSHSTAEEIVAHLTDQSCYNQFTREEFLKAAEAAGVGTEKYALSEYLPKVMDKMGVYPHPDNPIVFVPTDLEWMPEHLDPGTLPYPAMTETDKKLALKVAAFRAAGETSHPWTRFTVVDGVDALGGRPRHSTVRPLLREIAKDASDNGLRYDDELPGLRVNDEQAQLASHVNEDALAVVGWLDDDWDADAPTVDTGNSEVSGAPEVPSNDTVTVTRERADKEGLDRAVKAVETFLDAEGFTLESAPEPALRNKIARAMYPTEFPDEHESAYDPPDPCDLINEEDFERVRDEVRNDGPELITATISPRPRETADEWDQLIAAIQTEPDYIVSV